MVRRMMHHKESSSEDEKDEEDEEDDESKEGPLLTVEEVEALQRETEQEHDILSSNIMEVDEKQDQSDNENSSSSVSEKADQLLLVRKP